MKKIRITILCFLTAMVVSASPKAVQSFDTGYTISKVRVAKKMNQNIIIGSSYEGTIIGASYDGTILWENPLSGYMNHDLWCGDITDDEVDEIFAANADGTLYCLNTKGDLLWKFKKNSAPMYSICVVKNGNTSYVVCGGFDKKIYYLNKEGVQIKEVSSYTYSKENPWQPYSKAIPDSGCHLANFVRPLKNDDGTETLVVHGVIHTMAIIARGSTYFFNPLDEKPYKVIKLTPGRPLGEMRCADTNGDGNEELLMGSSTMIHDACMLKVDPVNESQKILSMNQWPGKIDGFGYRVVQPELIHDDGVQKYFILFGARILLAPKDFDAEKTEILKWNYSFNDMWNDKGTGKIILASVQSGGSCIHVVDTKNQSWKKEYENLKPKGKLAEILANTASIRQNLKSFEAPKWEKNPREVYLMSESIPRSIKPLVDDIKANATSPIFLNGGYTNRAEKYDRSHIQNERYRNRRDTRRKYDATSDDIVNYFSNRYGDAPGLAFWGGHGNDPYMFQRSTLERILNNANGKKTVLIFPELEDHSENFSYVMNDYIHPLVRHCRKTNGMFYVRTKHNFWYSTIHLPIWNSLMSGEYSDVFIPAMEETTDKSMELSIAGRLGVWASGAVDSWGTRCARDNPSFDRLRQYSHQMLPNHFLRNMIYHVSYGAQYLDNFTVDQEYMSLLWELIAKGVLYVPERNEIVSFSPVHLSMIKPDKHFIDRSSNVKWTTFYDEAFERDNQFVFSRLSGEWPGAPVTNWDFSKYAAGVKDRYLNFLPPYKNGLVLITPPQNGINANTDVPRGALTDHLHPIYKNMMKEFYTDGRYYYSANGKEKYDAEAYSQTIKAAIEENTKKLPITVSGDQVAWVASQSSPTHLRLTIIDGGYLNPDDRKAVVKFGTVQPIKIIDLLSKDEYEVTNKSLTIDVPCGMFRFIDIELDKPLH